MYRQGENIKGILKWAASNPLANDKRLRQSFCWSS